MGLFVIFELFNNYFGNRSFFPFRISVLSLISNYFDPLPFTRLPHSL
jgi:hypothetical protein